MERNMLMRAFAMLLALALPGCVPSGTTPGGDAGSDRDHTIISGAYLDQPLPGSEPVLFAPGIVSTAHHDLTLSIAPGAESMVVTRSDLTWRSFLIQIEQQGTDVPSLSIPPFTSKYADSYAAFSPDGRKIFFNSDRPLEAGGEPIEGRDIWVVERTSSGWGVPRHLGPLVNSEKYQACPSVTADGTLYFHAWVGGDATRNAELFRCRLIDGRYGPPENLGPAINTPAPEFHPYVAPDESFLLFDA
jgi:hypothetical protein